jgi:hypothetical protein
MDISLQEFILIHEGKTSTISWAELVEKGSLDKIVGAVGIRPVTAIVITQDCDAVRSPDISLCEIMEFEGVEGKAKNTTKPKAWANLITQHARVNQKWYYLPISPAVGFNRKMAVDFRAVVRVGRPDLESIKARFRIARLNDVALPHFRERVGEFFRRYAYNEWYPLNKEEYEAYKGDKPEPSKPYDWQR